MDLFPIGYQFIIIPTCQYIPLSWDHPLHLIFKAFSFPFTEATLIFNSSLQINKKLAL